MDKKGTIGECRKKAASKMVHEGHISSIRLPFHLSEILLRKYNGNIITFLEIKSDAVRHSR